MPPGQNKTTIYAPRVHGDLDLGRAPNRINNDGDQELARMIFPGTLLPGQTAAEIYTSGTDKKYPIATRLEMDERVFRYAKIGGTDAMGGRGVANLSTSQETALAAATSAVGATTVTITVQGSGLSADELSGGYLCYRRTRYYQHRILSHPAAITGATCVLTLETALVVQGVVSGETTLNAYANPWAKVGYGNGVGSACSIVGMPFGDIVVGQYTWVQTWGPVNICPGAFYGDAPNMKQCWFTSDGALAIFPSGSWTGPYQQAGFVMPCTYYDAGRHNMADGGHMIFLQICP